MVFLRRAAHVVSIVTLVALYGCTSQPPTPSPSVGTQAPQQQTGTQKSSADSGNAPVATPLAQQQGQKPQKQPDPQNQQSPSNWWDWFTNNGANWAIVALTIVLAGIGVMQWWATHTANKHNVVIERAYIDISHNPSGLRPHPNGGFVVTVGMKNNGNTPGEILGGKIWIGTTDKPGYQWVKQIEIAKIPPSYINPNDTFLMLDIRANIPAAVIQAAVTIWLGGEIDYTDRFGDAHHSTYGRRYVPSLIGNNLVFDESTTGMNNDVPLSRAKRREYGR